MENVEELDTRGDKKINIKSGKQTIKSLYELYKDGKLELQPEFQRGYVWNPAKLSLLIDSILLEIIIPPIYLEENSDFKDFKGKAQKHIVVVDGQQRLQSIFNFIDNKNRLTKNFSGFEIDPYYTYLNDGDVIKRKFSDLDKKLQQKILDYEINTLTIKQNNHEMAKRELFFRLNTGAMKLNDMEIIKSQFNGTYIKILDELSKKSCFARFFLKKKDQEDIDKYEKLERDYKISIERDNDSLFDEKDKDDFEKLKEKFNGKRNSNLEKVLTFFIIRQNKNSLQERYFDKQKRRLIVEHVKSNDNINENTKNEIEKDFENFFNIIWQIWDENAYKKYELKNGDYDYTSAFNETLYKTINGVLLLFFEKIIDLKQKDMEKYLVLCKNIKSASENLMKNNEYFQNYIKKNNGNYAYLLYKYEIEKIFIKEKLDDNKNFVILMSNLAIDYILINGSKMDGIRDFLKDDKHKIIPYQIKNNKEIIEYIYKQKEKIMNGEQMDFLLNKIEQLKFFLTDIVKDEKILDTNMEEQYKKLFLLLEEMV